MLAISPNIEKLLPSSVKTSLGKLPEDKQTIFEEEFKRKMKNPIVGLLLAILLPGFSFIYMGKIGMALLFWFTFGGGTIWFFIEIFTIGNKIRDHNEEEAKRLLRDMRIMDS